jgi:hypothetical protein
LNPWFNSILLSHGISLHKGSSLLMGGAL